jgi:pimeloyl-ACP methyl ester carboxylesterase
MDQANSAGVLAPYHGAQPPTPSWYDWAIAQEPERSSFACEGVAIELLTWGERGKPGLLFLHGDSAHADWWTYIAPFFAADWRCAAISWSGMGSSGRRDDYTFDSWANETIAAIDAADLDTGSGVVLVAHSLGGYPALLASARSDRIAGIITIDSAIIPRALMEGVPQPRPRPHRIYATQKEALSRFRFMPDTIGDQHYAVDHIARRSLERVDGGWSWRFDPEIWRDMEGRNASNLSDLPAAARCALAAILGERSGLIRTEIASHMRSVYPAGTPFITIPEAGHHIMADQPLALVAAVRACLAFWAQNDVMAAS